MLSKRTTLSQAFHHIDEKDGPGQIVRMSMRNERFHCRRGNVSSASLCESSSGRKPTGRTFEHLSVYFTKMLLGEKSTIVLSLE